MMRSVREAGKGLLGAGCCVSTAALMSLFLRDSANVRFVAPIICLQVVIVVSLHWGRGAGIVGALLSAVIIDVFLFPPFRSMKVTDPTELMMLLVLVGGAVFVYVLTSKVRSQ